MSKPLKYPELPPGEIVETYEDGGALRNDGVRLTPASQNPWYVLATVAGEQEGASIADIDHDLHAKNRRFWNGWMCQGMEEGERADLAQTLGLSEQALAPLSVEEMKAVKARFKKAFPHSAPEGAIPHPGFLVDLRRVYFNIRLDLSGFNLRQALFDQAHFTRSVYLHGVYFKAGGSFRGAHFAETAVFYGSCFAGYTEFQAAHFNRFVLFRDVRFEDAAVFQEAHFTGGADFHKVRFHKDADFSDGCFKAKTVFDGATFKGEVPMFYHREMHQNTSFTDDPKLWPEVTAKNAKDGKRAYTRLRQVAAEIYDPDLEHFFLRQEMKCKEALAGWFDRVAFCLYRKLADSGISVAWPAAVLAGLWALGAAMFAGYFLAPVGHTVPEYATESPVWTGIGLSFANVFAFLGLSRAFFADVLAGLPLCLKYFAGMQTVLGAVFFFLLALGLRNRFRLK